MVHGLLRLGDFACQALLCFGQVLRTLKIQRLPRTPEEGSRTSSHLWFGRQISQNQLLAFLPATPLFFCCSSFHMFAHVNTHHPFTPQPLLHLRRCFQCLFTGWLMIREHGVVNNIIHYVSWPNLKSLRWEDKSEVWQQVCFLFTLLTVQLSKTFWVLRWPTVQLFLISIAKTVWHEAWITEKWRWVDATLIM